MPKKPRKPRKEGILVASHVDGKFVIHRPDLWPTKAKDDSVPGEKTVSMLAEIVRGKAPADSKFVTDERTRAMWDQLAREVEAIHARGGIVEFPREF